MSTIQMTITMGLETCYKCGIQFAVPLDYQTQRKRDHASFYCPSGHVQCYSSKSDVEIEREKAFAAQAQINEERHLRLVAESERDKALKARKRIEKRVSAGICTCCNRSFDDLKRHMASKHKEYGINAGKEQKQLTA